jgi:116 kDa U5 small nuclear ribonucleoprotein component
MCFELVGERWLMKVVVTDPKPLLKLVFAQFLGQASGFVDMVTRFIPSPADNAANKIEHIYSGPLYGTTVASMRACDPSGPLMVNIVKLFPTPDGASFLAFGRVLSGTVRAGDTVRVLGENYTTTDEEDLAVRSVASLSVAQARYRVDVTRAGAGNLILLEGVDESIVKTATITANSGTKPWGHTFFVVALYGLLCVYRSRSGR